MNLSLKQHVGFYKNRHENCLELMSPWASQYMGISKNCLFMLRQAQQEWRSN